MAGPRILMACFRPLGIPLSWIQLTHNRGRFASAVAGTAFAVMLMLFQWSVYYAFIKGKAMRPIEGMNGQIMLVSSNSTNLLVGRPFPRTRLMQAANLPEVLEASPLYLADSSWTNPRTGVRQEIVVFGVEPAHPVFTFPGIQENLGVLRQEDGFLFDGASSTFYGPVREMVGRQGQINGELAGKRITVRGLFTMGSTMAAESHMIGGTQAFFRAFPGRAPDQVDLGLLRLKAGADPKAVQARLQASLPRDIQVFTKAGFARKEQAFWAHRSAMGEVIFSMIIVAMLTGAVVVYQILFMDVTEHLGEYATLKATGLTDRFLAMVVIGEALILHGIGFTIGCGLAKVGFLLVKHLFDLPMPMPFSMLSVVFVLTGVMCCGSGLIATRQLRSADPVDTFQG
jgi:putative ABC transport system permease protein